MAKRKLPIPAETLNMEETLPQRLIAAYPDHLDRFENNFIVWKDGTKMLWDDGKAGKTFQELEENADLEDMFAFEYPKGAAIFKENFDPGRIRNEAFFRKMYGESAAMAGKQLIGVDWFGSKINVTKVNGVDKALGRVAEELKALPDLRKYLETPGGGHYWRVIAGTTRLSAHSFGIAVDVNTAYTDYWRWGSEFKAGKPLVYRNRIPLQIVEIFERAGFIWGGKWYHYDTMHFEYRPELL
ncbi:MAG: M15 family metallopeptidase [Bacteroidia bacterium]|nr:M15 family metallopeptidase [Bacteroidia bacterium]